MCGLSGVGLHSLGWFWGPVRWVWGPLGHCLWSPELTLWSTEKGLGFPEGGLEFPGVYLGMPGSPEVCLGPTEMDLRLPRVLSGDNKISLGPSGMLSGGPG